MPTCKPLVTHSPQSFPRVTQVVPSLWILPTSNSPPSYVNLVALPAPVADKSWTNAEDLLSAIHLMELSTSETYRMIWVGVAWYMTEQACNQGICNTRYTEHSVNERVKFLRPLPTDSQQNAQEFIEPTCTTNGLTLPGAASYALPPFQDSPRKILPATSSTFPKLAASLTSTPHTSYPTWRSIAVKSDTRSAPALAVRTSNRAASTNNGSSLAVAPLQALRPDTSWVELPKYVTMSDIIIRKPI